MTTTEHSAPVSRSAPGRPRPGALSQLLHDADAAWARAALLALLLATAVLYVWGLGRSGYANDFYAAAVQAGTQSWKAFFFGSFDAANYITVDKPPASLWVMELSGRLFGFSSWSMLVPQALEGVAAVGLLYATVRRWFSPAAALLSAGILAITPVAVVMFRYNNPDALLVLLMVAGAYATTRAVESGRTRWLALAGGLIGFAFLTKMFQAFLVVPAFALVYLVAAPTPLRRRVWQLLVAGAALVAAGGWWVAVVALTPAADRPYIGGSTGNSIVDLIFGYNGLGRISGNEVPGGRGGGPNFSGTTGITRLFNAEMGGQISWLLPAALIALVAGLWLTRRAPNTDRHRAALILWGAWLVVSGLVYSYASGIIHPYYTNTLAPAIAALTGITAVALWQARARIVERLLLAAMLAVTAWWSFVLLDRTPSWQPWLRYAVLVGGLAVAVAFALAGARLSRPALAGLATAGLLAGLGGSIAYTLSSVTSAQSSPLAAAGPAAAGSGFGGRPTGARLGDGTFPGGAPPVGSLPPGTNGVPGVRVGRPGAGTTTTSKALVALLRRNASSYTWVAATGSSMSAAPIQLATGKPVMSIGGFNGNDQAMTLTRFEQLVAAGRIHYYLGSTGGPGGYVGGPGGQGPGGGGGASSEIGAWVEKTFATTTVGSVTVYDLTSPLASSGA